MTIAAWLAELPRRLVVRSRVRKDYLLRPDQLAHLALCERARVDRNGSSLSVLRSAEPLSGPRQKIHQLVNDKLQLRLRITDAAGTSSDGRLVVLLPDTPLEGAIQVADDLRRLLNSSIGAIDFEIAIYPDDLPPAEPNLTPQPVATDGIRRQPADVLFARQCPAWKRGVDIVGASIGLLAAAPIILAAALAVRATSQGNPIFAQQREGLGGRRFWIYKLRTMRTDAETLKQELRSLSEQDGPAFKMSNDPRVTRLGRFLRQFSIDELPQLWNVLRGDMSLVGPRPLPVEESLSCTRWQRQRLAVRPGLTCIWQVRGRNVVSFDEWIRMDLRYIRRRCLWYDLFLIASTGPAVVSRRGPR